MKKRLEFACLADETVAMITNERQDPADREDGLPLMHAKNSSNFPYRIASSLHKHGQGKLSNQASRINITQLHPQIS